MKNEHNARHSDQTEYDFACRYPVTVDKWIEQSGKEAHQRQADHSDRYVRGLDTAIEKQPVYRQQQSHRSDTQSIAGRKFPQFLQQEKYDIEQHTSQQHTIPHQQSLVQGNQPPEDSRTSGYQYREVKFDKSLFHPFYFLSPQRYKTIL